MKKVKANQGLLFVQTNIAHVIIQHHNHTCRWNSYDVNEI